MKNALHSSSSSMLRFACLGFWLHFGKIHGIHHQTVCWVAFSLSTSQSRDGLETHPWSRLVSSRIFLAMSRSRLGLGNLGLESRLGLVANRLGLGTSRLGLVE